MNKVAVVTGGAGGIGQAVAERFAKDSYAVVILDVNDDGGKQLAADFRKRGIDISFHRADLTQEGQVQAAFDKITVGHGRIDILVNVAGGSMHRHTLEEFPLKNWQAVVDANLTSTFLCCRAVVGIMKNQKAGAVVNISSDIAFSGSENRSAYAAAKAGVLGLTKTLALELATFGVRQRRSARSNFYAARSRRLLGHGMGRIKQANSHGPPRRAGRRRRSDCFSRQRRSQAHDGTNDPCERWEDNDVGARFIAPSDRRRLLVISRSGKRRLFSGSIFGDSRPCKTRFI
jgi:NADP-dependent 3-hydroxy acid dehydrogenase YdfG